MNVAMGYDGQQAPSNSDQSGTLISYSLCEITTASPLGDRPGQVGRLSRVGCSHGAPPISPVRLLDAAS